MKRQLLLIAVFFVVGAITSQAQTLAVKKQILNQIIDLGEITEQKVKQAGGVSKVLEIQSVDLNRDSKPEFIVRCGWCSSTDPAWVFRQVGSGVELLYDAGARSLITPLKTSTKGWRNLRVETAQSATGEVASGVIRFNGRTYQ